MHKGTSFFQIPKGIADSLWGLNIQRWSADSPIGDNSLPPLSAVSLELVHYSQCLGLSKVFD